MAVRGHLGPAVESLAGGSGAAPRRLLPPRLGHAPHADRADVLTTQVAGGQIQGISRVWAAAVRSPQDNSLTLLIVNDADQPWTAQFMMEELPQRLAVLRSLPNADPAKTLTYQPVAVRDGAAELRLEPFSLTIVTDTPLPVDGPGRF